MHIWAVIPAETVAVSRPQSPPEYRRDHNSCRRSASAFGGPQRYSVEPAAPVISKSTCTIGPRGHGARTKSKVAIGLPLHAFAHPTSSDACGYKFCRSHRCKEPKMTANRSLEERVRAIEDRLEIYNVIASHPPSADTGGNAHIAASWVEDGEFDRGETLTSARGRDAIARQVLSPDHQAAIARGLAHFTGLPHVAISGDTALVTSYLQIVVPQTEGNAVEVP